MRWTERQFEFHLRKICTSYQTFVAWRSVRKALCKILALRLGTDG